MQKQRYISVDVFVHSSRIDCSLNGVTVTHKEKLVVAAPTGYISEAAVQKHGYVVLEATRNGNDILFKQAGNQRWCMFGGNFVYSCDSRFAQAYGNRPIRVHDRMEG